MRSQRATDSLSAAHQTVVQNTQPRLTLGERTLILSPIILFAQDFLSRNTRPSSHWSRIFPRVSGLDEGVGNIIMEALLLNKRPV